ncbi:GNAT family N-acetyltransferase [Streptomyces europaeiscabiei]|uniref:GNAT family N-acetyltransferase n=1 Tax=Streptomyces europaeiscabiei TaxID=146819 RepID=UPI0029A0BE89|nr:GNAT family N-acetyltransferase [Streptomyces europaeiscabiei]MDX2773660.1 GNAT family N-acetyltransferase [Streptomyces europaeiscabiei]
MTIDDVSLSHHGGEEASELLEELCDTYTDAYGVKPGEEKTAAFRRRAAKQFTRPGFALVTARDGDLLVGFIFGYTLSAGDMHWWGGVQPGPSAEFLEETGSRTWVLSEIEVRRTWQGRGTGRALHDAALGARDEERATLATGPDAAAQPVYESWGWRRVGRIPGDEGDYYSAYDLFVLELPVSRY